MNVRTNCGTCGDVVMGRQNIQLRICQQTRYATYIFVCPQCGNRIVREATQRIVEVLAACGIPLEIWDLPAELEETHTGPPFTPDDVLDWHILLQDDINVTAQLRTSLGDELMSRDP